MLLSVLASCQGEAKFASSSKSALKSTNVQLAPAAIAIAPEAVTIKVGEQTKYIVTISKDGAQQVVATDKAEWSFSGVGVGEMSDATSGQVTGKGVGRVTVTAKVGDLVATATLIVETPIPATAEFDLTISPANFALPLAGDQSIQAIATYTDGKVENVTSKATWTSSLPLIATVDDSVDKKGNVKAIATGKAIISSSYLGKSATSTLAVNQPLIIDLAQQVGKKVSVCVAYDKIKIPGHTCDSAKFNLSLQGLPVGVFNLNNALTGSSVEGGVYTNAWDGSGAFKLRFTCNLPAPQACHSDVSIVSIIGEVIDEYGKQKYVVIDQGLAKPGVSYSYKFADFVLRGTAPVFGPLCSVK